ncbi:hypothetical protein D9613_012661 [Agrocybe pediades]|uniref:Uncharacterized protein n=1 Tax=Agrocybe pediades TaxID=84607 RepID=A0A8H4QV71_9AGAR|nr:hypothetical protein D9613_012661 [Agrocybe pediades]
MIRVLIRGVCQEEVFCMDLHEMLRRPETCLRGKEPWTSAVSSSASPTASLSIRKVASWVGLWDDELVTEQLESSFGTTLSVSVDTAREQSRSYQSLLDDDVKLERARYGSKIAFLSDCCLGLVFFGPSQIKKSHSGARLSSHHPSHTVDPSSVDHPLLYKPGPGAEYPFQRVGSSSQDSKLMLRPPLQGSNVQEWFGSGIRTQLHYRTMHVAAELEIFLSALFHAVIGGRICRQPPLFAFPPTKLPNIGARWDLNGGEFVMREEKQWRNRQSQDVGQYIEEDPISEDADSTSKSVYAASFFPYQLLYTLAQSASIAGGGTCSSYHVFGPQANDWFTSTHITHDLDFRCDQPRVGTSRSLGKGET